MIDPCDAAKNRQWDIVRKYLEENAHLNPNEIAIQLGRSPATIRRWRRKAGMTKKYPFTRRQNFAARVLPTVTDPEVWDNEEWFKEHYEEKSYGISAIGRIIKRSPRLVTRKLNKYGIRIKSHSEAVRSANPCANEEWLVYHYGNREEYLAWAKKTGNTPDEGGGKEWSLKKCSTVADVVIATVYGWLVRVNIEGGNINIRDISESVAGNKNPFYGKRHPPEILNKVKKYLKRGTFDPNAATGDQEIEEP